ncbi:MAG TPA: rhodanese-like domain-containing protein [Myxococcota bacterium]|nr:rhodanese-like domain-containing protein [Myxococcota bacterium]
MQHAPGFIRLCEASRARIREVEPDEVAAALAAGATLVDVREDHEWAGGHLPGAVHLGRGVIERDAEHRWPDPATPLVLYCGGGYRSALAADALQQLGFSDVRSLAGGVRRWQAEGRPWQAGAGGTGG